MLRIVRCRPLARSGQKLEREDVGLISKCGRNSVLRASTFVEDSEVRPNLHSLH